MTPNAPKSPEKLLIRALKGEATERPPIWLMRQAGRYLPEYHPNKDAAGGMIPLCNSPEHAAEAMLQPMRRFGLDASILFADLPQIAAALGQTLEYKTGDGPVLSPPIESAADIDRLSAAGVIDYLAPVLETLKHVKPKLPSDAGLIGFAGAPWTVALYMVEGRGGTDHARVKAFALGDPAGFQKLIDLLVDAISGFLSAQIEAGAETVQIFESWASSLPACGFERWCVEPIAEIRRRLKAAHPGTPVIAFPRAAGLNYIGFADKTGVDCVAVDQAVPPEWAASALQKNGVCVQGNLDPELLILGGDVMLREVDRICDALDQGPFIFNLGHGVTPRTPPEHVAALVAHIRKRYNAPLAAAG